MREVLISIQPKWCEKIAHIIGYKAGKPIYEKSVEVRKTRPKIETPFKVYIYCTQGDALAYPCLNNPKFAIHKMATSHSLHGRKLTKKEREESDYTFANGKVIGEFVCQTILKYECEFVDDDCYEDIVCIGIDEDGSEIGFTAWSNDGDEQYEDTFLYKTSRVEYEELKKYIGLGFGTFYGWHISDLKIYDEPKELGEFFRYCGDNPKCDGCEAHYYSSTECGTEDYCCSVVYGCKPLTRPPQSWCYVEGGAE